MSAGESALQPQGPARLPCFIYQVQIKEQRQILEQISPVEKENTNINYETLSQSPEKIREPVRTDNLTHRRERR